MMNRYASRLLPALALAAAAGAQDLRVNVILENLAPSNGTFLTPVWVGFHNGTFDTYDGGTLANTLPIQGSDALERLAEDGNTGPITRDFGVLRAGRIDTTIPGPNGPIAPGDRTTRTFLLNPNATSDRYFSYASMVIPSNDAFIANGNPRAHQLFDSNGRFIASDFIVAGQDAVNDAGTERNDELPINTAFFGQMMPNTGVATSNVIVRHPGFNARGTGGILDATRFRDGDLTVGGYPFLRVGFRAAPAVTEVRLYSSLALGLFEVPPVQSSAIALAGAALIDQGTKLAIAVQSQGLADLTAAHLHLGKAGTNGPVVVDLLANSTSSSANFFVAEIDGSDLAGPIADFPLDELARRIDAGEIYLNLHTTANPNGELRGQLGRF